MIGSNRVAALLDVPLVLAPMEDVTDAVFRRVCRSVGASLCVTEFIGAEQLIASSKLARRRSSLGTDEGPTALQIYGANADLLVEAARIAETMEPAIIDINCGCWVPQIARRGAGAGWLREPAAMVEMARRIVATVALPVTVKTRIGWGPESHMPIVDLARRLEDVGVEALTIHCRTASMGHSGVADWSWARRAREVVSIPVIVNGDVRTPDDVVRALDETHCAAAMVGRSAIRNPWIFREARSRLAGKPIEGPTRDERRALYLALLDGNVESRGEKSGVASTKRHVDVLGDLDPADRRRLLAAHTMADAREAFDQLVMLADAEAELGAQR